MSELKISTHTLAILRGGSPSEDRCHTVIMFDVSCQKKYRKLIKILKAYSSRVQKSVFEGSLTRQQARELFSSLEKLMSAKQYFSAEDSIRIYSMSGSSEVTVFGPQVEADRSQDIFI